MTTRKPAEFKDWPDDFQPAWEYKVVISDGGDGDNRYGMVDLGLLKYSFESFRLIAVDAPEVYSGPAMVRGWGKKTAAALAEICPPGTRVIAVTQKDKTSFDRFVAYLHLENSLIVNDLINAWMAEQEWHDDYRSYIDSGKDVSVLPQ